MSFTFKMDTPRFCVRCGQEADLILRYDVSGDEHGESVEDYEIDGPAFCEGKRCRSSLGAAHADIATWVRSDQGTRELIQAAHEQMALMGPAD